MSTPRSADILRYWLATLRHEEALAVRPRARRATPGREAANTATPNMGSPAPGQDYMKLPFAENERLLVAQLGDATLSLNSEACAFFENWLFTQYRQSGDDTRLAHLLCFPSVLLPRGQLAGVLRSAVSLRWLNSAGEEFTPPTPSQRAKGEFAAPPSQLRITPAVSDDGSPFFIDAKLLRDTLKIDAERLDEFFGQLRTRTPSPAELIAQVCNLLAAQLRDDGADLDEVSDMAAKPHPNDSSSADASSSGSPGANADKDATPSDASKCATLLSRLHRATHARLTQLNSRSRVFDVAVLLDASRNRATFHVQRDLQAALSLLEEGELDARSPLAAYLGRRKFGGDRQTLLGRWRSGGLTDSQRQAAELFLGSTIAAVQGPPGTGKTHVILSLAADELVRKVSPLTGRAHPGAELLVVCSTNNRAVDNVVHPLGKDQESDRLPIALRVGSREVVEKVTSAELQRAKRWLETRTAATDEDYAASTARYAKFRSDAETALAPWTRRQRLAERLQRCRAELESLRDAPSSQAEADLRALTRSLGIELTPTILTSPTKVARALGPLCRRLTELSTMAEAHRGTAALRLEQHFKLTRNTALEEAEQTLGSKLQLNLPPTLPEGASPVQQREAWEQGAEDALSPLLELQLALQSQADSVSGQQLQSELEDELRSLEVEERSAPTIADAEFDWRQVEPVLHELFEAAAALRECWALKNKVALIGALQKSIETCKRSRSLRSLLQSSKGPGTWLRRLYPVWGCTLLSLGNVFPPEAAQAERMVIDEAGQCHSAYAASALLRGRSALVIGDVNQLEPVVEISRQDETRVLRGLELRLDASALDPFRMYKGCHNSAQSVADRVVVSRPTLIDHFRCQPEIAAVSEMLCGYGLVTHTPRRSCVALAAELTHPLLHTPTLGQQQRFAGSWLNDDEVETVIAWARRLLRAGLQPDELGIITPFRGQLEALWRSLRAANVPVERPQLEDEAQVSLFSSSNSGVAVGTVHRFQGGERRVVLFSTTVTQRQSLRFVDERVNLVNVAASRAKEHLITIGHGPTLGEGTHTRTLIETATIVHPS